MGSGLNFRSRPLDIDRPLPVYEEYELPDLFDSCLVNRTVTKLPTGMEKDEESELDLQRALIAQKNHQKFNKALIPIPEVFLMEIDYNPRKINIPRPFIGEELVSIIDEFSNYDMDAVDYKFVTNFNAHSENYHDTCVLTFDEFENMMELMEVTYKSTKDFEKVLELIDKKQINKYVFQHWEKKRKHIKPNYSLIPTVRTHDKISQHDPFVAFRKRVEKMQTRKNRKLDENRYTNAVRISHMFTSKNNLLDSVLNREKQKFELESNCLNLFYMRCSHYNSTNKSIQNELNNNPDLDINFQQYYPNNQNDDNHYYEYNNRRIIKHKFWRHLWAPYNNINQINVNGVVDKSSIIVNNINHINPTPSNISAIDSNMIINNQQHSQSHVYDQPQSYVCDQSQSHVCDQSQSNVCDQSQSNVCDQSQSNVCDQPQSHVCDQPQSHVCDQSQPHVYDQPQSHVCDQSQSHVYDQSQPHVCDQPQSHVCDKFTKYAMKRPLLSFDDELFNNYSSFKKCSPVYLRSLRTKSPFKSSCKDETIRKLYLANCVTKYCHSNIISENPLLACKVQTTNHVPPNGLDNVVERKKLKQKFINLCHLNNINHESPPLPIPLENHIKIENNSQIFNIESTNCINSQYHHDFKIESNNEINNIVPDNVAAADDPDHLEKSPTLFGNSNKLSYPHDIDQQLLSSRIDPTDNDGDNDDNSTKNSLHYTSKSSFFENILNGENNILFQNHTNLISSHNDDPKSTSKLCINLDISSSIENHHTLLNTTSQIGKTDNSFT